MEQPHQAVNPAPIRHTSDASGQLTVLKEAVLARIRNQMVSPNSAANIIATGKPAPQPQVSNPAAVAVDTFKPLPGRHLPQYMNIRVTNAPGPQVDNVADALQRYLNIEPRREPQADPKSEASTTRFPTGILQARQRWDDIFPFQFSINGVSRYQKEPSFYMAGGSLQARIVSPGVSEVTTPSTTSQPVLGRLITYPPAFAAQMAVAEIQAAVNNDSGGVTIAVGPPLRTQNPNLDPSQAWRNATQIIQEKLNGEPTIENPHLLGGYDQPFPLGNPAFAAAKAINTYRKLVTDRSPVVVGTLS